MPDTPTASSAQGGFTPPTAEELSALIPQYEITKVLGIGGMGAVYKGRQTKLLRDVAIKVLPADATGSEGDDAFNFAERFQREAKAMAHLHHQRIIAVHDFGEATREDGKPILYIVMEFVDGTDLNYLIKNEALGVDQRLAVITQICDALHYAHERGIVHRDIKPANIMLDVNGNVKVADFGLAKLTGNDAAAQAQLTMTNMAMGTPDYVSPEQLEAGRDVDNRADIYSLGVMIYEMLTGAVPRGAFLPPSQKSTDDLDPRLDGVVNMAMQADPDTRYQDVTELWTDIENIRTTSRPAATDTTAASAVLLTPQTGRVSIKPGGGTTQKVAVNPATTIEATQAKKKTLLISLVSVISLLVIAALTYVILAPTPTNDDLASIDQPKPPSGAQDKVLAGPPDTQPITPSPENPKQTNTPTQPSPPPKASAPKNPEPRTGNPEPQAIAKPINLLALVDPATAGLSGTTERVAGGIKNSANLKDPNRRARFQFPTPVESNHWEFEWEFTRSTLTEKPISTNVMFPVYGHHAGLAIESTAELGNNPTWLTIKNKGRRGPHTSTDRFTKLDTPNTARLRVDGRDPAKVRVQLTLNGDLAIDFTSPANTFIGLGPNWNPSNAKLIALGTHDGTMTVHRATLRYLKDNPAQTSPTRLTEAPGNPETSPDSSPALRSSQSEERVNLLTGLDPATNTIVGAYQIQDGALIRADVATTSTAIIELPGTISSSYTLRSSFTSVSPVESTNFALPVGDRHILFTLGGWVDSFSESPLSGLGRIDTKDPRRNPTGVFHHRLEKDRTYTIEARVTAAGDQATIIVDLDGQEFVHWTGNLSSLSISIPSAEKIEPQKLYIYEYGKTVTRFNSLTLIPGTPGTTPGTTPTETPTETPTTSTSEAGQKIATLLDEYNKKFQATLGDAHNKSITALNTSYTGAIERAEKPIAASGNLDALIFYRGEIEAAKAAGSNPITAPIPPGAPDALGTMRATYTTTITQREKTRDADAAPLLRQFDQALDQLQRTFTQEQKIEDALEVRQARDQLKEKGTALFVSSASLPTSAWIPLFNGRDLEEWTIAGSDENITVDNDTLTLSGAFTTYLYYTGDAHGGTFHDFELAATVKTEDACDAGIYFHTRYQKGVEFVPNAGIEINISPGSTRRSTGSIFNVADLTESAAPEGEWFELLLRVEGQRVTVTIDGNEINSWTQPPDWPGIQGKFTKRIDTGTIALQRHEGGDPASAVSFRDLRIRPLD